MCHLCWFHVFSVLHISQALHGAEVEGHADCVVMPGLFILFIYLEFILLLINNFPIIPGPKTGFTDGLAGGDYVSVFHVAVDSEMAWGGRFCWNAKGNRKRALPAIPLCVPTLH